MTKSNKLKASEKHTSDFLVRGIVKIVMVAIFLLLNIMPVNAVPSTVLSPVIGPIYQTTGPVFSLQYDKWYFWQHQTGYHQNLNQGIGGANDYYAWDVNFHTPSNGNFDLGQPVYAIESGIVEKKYGGTDDTTYGEVLINHTGWYSAYVHMDNIQVIRGQPVTKDTILGYISYVSPQSNPLSEADAHLHFAVYSGTNTYQGLKSVNCIIQERSGAIPIVLDPPVLVNPGSASSPGSTITTLTPIFSWQPVAGASQYGLYISDNTTGTPSIVFNSNTYGAVVTGTSYELPSGILQNNKKYRWNMNTYGSSGWGRPNAERYYFQAPITSNPPNTPLTPSGQSSGKTGVSYIYTTSTTDPDGNSIKYIFDWGDEFNSNTSFINSGASASASHCWNSPGTYLIRVIATDSNGASSGWSGFYTVTISNPELPEMMFRLNANHAGDYSTVAGNIAPNNLLLWRYKAESSVSSSPVVINNVVYIAGGTKVYALNAATGIKKWSYDVTGVSVIGYNSPAVVNSVVYIGGGKNVSALDADTGKLLWNFKVDSWDGEFTSPVVKNGIVYIGCLNGYIYALDATTGAQLWKFGNSLTGTSADSPPAVENGVVYFGFDDTFGSFVYALDAFTGDLIWEHEIGSTDLMYSSPTIVNDVVYIGGGDKVYALNAATGAQLWMYPTGWTVWASPAVVNGIVYIGSMDSKIYAMNAATGAQLWNYSTGSSIISSPAIANGIVYIGSWDKKLYALNAATGAYLWSYETGSQVRSSPAIVNGSVYFGSEDYYVYALGNSTHAILTGTSKVGLYQKSTGTFFLKNSNDPGNADSVFQYGAGGDDWVPLIGDWDGDGKDTAGLYQKSIGAFFIKNSNDPGNADSVFQYGAGGDDWIQLAGDWDGDGKDTVGAYQKSTGVFFLKNSNGPGNADLAFQYGAGGNDWVPLVGDWDNDGKDTVGLYQKSIGVFFLKNSNGAGEADVPFQYGAGGNDWIQLAGDWDGDQHDTIGVYQKSIGTFFLKNSNAYGNADNQFQFGWGGNDLVPIVGRWV